MSDEAARQGVVALIREANAAFAAGDAERWAACFADDARMLLLHRDELAGRPAILEFWRTSFARLDTSAWEWTTEALEVEGDHADVFTVYTERLSDREADTRTRVRGRIAWWIRRQGDDAWRVTLLMNSHSHPVEPIA